MKTATRGTRMECLECGHTFRKVIGARTFEVKCTKCGSYDTEVAEPIVNVRTQETRREIDFRTGLYI